MSVKIFGWLGDHAGCGWYRIMMPLAALRHAGVEANWSATLTEPDWESDIIVAQRTCKPGPSAVLQRMAAHKGTRPRLVFELDDNLWQIDRHNAARTFYSDPDIRANLRTNIEVCDLVTVSTEPLAEVVRKWNPNVFVLPNMIPGEWLEWRHGTHIDRVTVGWQGSDTHDGDWPGVGPVIERWFNRTKKDYPLEMHTLGKVPRHFPDIYPHRQTGWSKSIEAYYRTIDWSIALAPLADTPFNESKSDLRVLEAAMLGIPVVASATAAYAGSVQHGVTGLLARTAQEWAQHLQTLVEEPEAREEMGKAAREWARTRTIEATCYNWLEAWVS